jgi:hypothetical protein
MTDIALDILMATFHEWMDRLEARVDGVGE